MSIGSLDADSLGSLAEAIKREAGSSAMVSLASTCTALWRGQGFRLQNGAGPHALKREVEVLRQERIKALQQKLKCDDVRSLLRSSPDLRRFAVDAFDAMMIASLYLHDMSGEANGKAIRCARIVLTAYARRLCRHVAQHCSSCPGRRLDGGLLPIDELMGVEAVDSIDLSRRRLGTKSAIIIGACVAGNWHLHELNLSANHLGEKGATALAPAIRDSASITVVDLRYNNMNAESATMLASIAKKKKISLCGITPDQSVADFTPKDYYGPFMGPGDVILLTADLAIRASVTCLDVRYNNIPGKWASELSAAVLEMPQMKKFNEIPIKDMRTNSLTQIDLSGKGVGVVGGMVVAGLLPAMASLREVLAFLPQSFALPSSFHMANVCVQINLAENGIGGYYGRNDNLIYTPEGPKAISDALRVSASLTSINLKFNHLGPEGAKALAPAICDNTSLMWVDLRLNYLTVGDESLLSKAVEGLPGLELLL
jgi:hypothetical protein